MYFTSLHSLRIKHYRLYKLRCKLARAYYSLFPPNQILDHSKIKDGSIPVIINNFNRYTSLKTMIEWFWGLKKRQTSIIIIDNASTLPDLLSYYDEISSSPNVQMIRLKKNEGINQILKVSMALGQFNNYIVSDADLIPYEHTPADIIDKMEEILNTYPNINHVGASLEINDLPNHYPLKHKVIDWEKKYWNEKLTPELFIAPVDTTFSMYRKSSLVTALAPSLRLNRPYTFRHVDWYLNPDNLSSEENMIIQCCSDCSTWNTLLRNIIQNKMASPSQGT